MRFLVYTSYVSDAAKVEAARPAHRQYAQRQVDEGRLMLVAAMHDDAGAVFIYDAESQQEVEELITADPFSQHEVFAEYRIHPVKVLVAVPEALGADA